MTPSREEIRRDSKESSDVSKDIARIALREDGRFDGDILEEVLAYCWDQLGLIKTAAELEVIKSALKIEEDCQ